MSELSDYLNQHLGDRVADDIVREAKKHGFDIDRTVVYGFLNGKHAKRPREATLAALAAGMGLDVRRLRELAGKPPGEAGPYIPTPESASLTKAQREALDQLIVSIVTGGQHGRAAAEAEKNNVTPIHGATWERENPGLNPRAAQSGRKSRGKAIDDEMNAAGEESQDPGEGDGLD